MTARAAHVIARTDRARAGCSHPDHLESGGLAVIVEHVPHAGGISFFRYCADCWHKPAANGGPSAHDRTGVDLPDALDFQRRWLAECRAHGETKRKLIAAQHELGLHTDCKPGCQDDTPDCRCGQCSPGNYTCISED